MGVKVVVRILEDGIPVSEFLYGNERRSCNVVGKVGATCRRGDTPGRQEFVGRIPTSRTFDTSLVAKEGRYYKIQVVATALAWATGGIGTTARLTVNDMTADVSCRSCPP